MSSAQTTTKYIQYATAKSANAITGIKLRIGYPQITGEFRWHFYKRNIPNTLTSIVYFIQETDIVNVSVMFDQIFIN